MSQTTYMRAPKSQGGRPPNKITEEQRYRTALLLAAGVHTKHIHQYCNFSGYVVKKILAEFKQQGKRFEVVLKEVES